MGFAINTELNKVRILFVASLAISIVLATLFLLSVRLVGKKLVEFQEIDAKLREAQMEYVKLMNVLYEMPAEKDLESIKFIYLPLDRSIEFIDKIEKIFAHKLKVTVGSLHSSNLNNGNIVLLQMPVTAEGELKNILAFIKILENLPYLSSINSIDLKYINNNRWQLLADVQIYALKTNR